MYPIKQVNHSYMKLNELSWWVDESNRNVLLILLIGNLIGISKPRPCLSCYEHFAGEPDSVRGKETKNGLPGIEDEELIARNWLPGIYEGQEFRNESLDY